MGVFDNIKWIWQINPHHKHLFIVICHPHLKSFNCCQSKVLQCLKTWTLTEKATFSESRYRWWFYFSFCFSTWLALLGPSVIKSGKIMVLGKWFHIIAGLIWNYLTSEGFKCRIARHQKLLQHILWKREKNISIILEMSDTFCKILKWKSHHQSAGDREKIQVFNYEAWNYFFPSLACIFISKSQFTLKIYLPFKQADWEFYLHFFMVHFVYLYHLFLFVTDIATITAYSSKRCLEIKCDCFVRFGNVFS